MSWTCRLGHADRRRGGLPACCTFAAAIGALAAASGACGSRSGLDAAAIAAPDGSEVAASTPSVDAGAPRVPELARAQQPEPEPPVCVDITRRYTPTPPTVLLLIDQSASMHDPFGASTRWDVLRDAIVEPTAGLLAWLDDSANIGLMLYTSLDGFEEGRECPILERVDVRLGNAERIRAFYRSAEPFDGGDTPTGDAIDVAVRELAALDAGPAKYVLLLTDGVPDTCSEPDPQNGFDAAVDAVVRAREQGISVRSVGVSPEIARAGLQRMANAGAGKPLELVFGRDDAAERPLYASTDPKELAEQLQGAIGDVRSCTIALGTAIGAVRAREGVLVLDGEPLEYAAPDGWRFIDEDTISIEGEACRRILRSSEQLEVGFPCVPFGDLR